jgi:hypothetical protein
VAAVDSPRPTKVGIYGANYRSPQAGRERLALSPISTPAGIVLPSNDLKSNKKWRFLRNITKRTRRRARQLELFGKIFPPPAPLRSLRFLTPNHKTPGNTTRICPRTLAGDHANRRLIRLQRGLSRPRSLIGSKILSGRTKDQNVGYIAEYLTALGIDLKEVRVLGDEETAIVDALNALRRRCTYASLPAGSGRPTVTHRRLRGEGVWCPEYLRRDMFL